MHVRSALGTALAFAALGSLLLASCSSEPEGAQSATEADEAVGQAESALAAPGARVRARGLLPGMKAYHGGPQIAAVAQCANPRLAYFGGPLLQSPVIVPVFWNSNVNAALQANMSQFYADVTRSSYWSWLWEYDSLGLTPGTNQAILPGTATAGVVLAPVHCPASTTTTCDLTDAQLQTELARQIGLGVLPAPTLDCTGNVQTIYMVDLPPNISLQGPGGGRSCAGSGFCAYHSTGTYGTSTPLVYAALMDEFTGSCATGCGNNATALENATDSASHELVEAVTDPDIGLDTVIGYAAPAGWGDNSNSCGEIADICDDYSPGDTITVSGRTWVVQQVWSNKQNKCTSTGPAKTCPAGDDCGTVPHSCGATVSCGTCTAPQSCGGGTPSNPNVCGCTPLTACPAGDACGTVADGCGGTVTCGSCAANQVCTNNQCVASGSSSSSGSSSGSTSSGMSSSSSSSSGGAGGSGAGMGGSGSGTGGSTSSGAVGTGGSGSSGSPDTSSDCGCKAAGEPLDASGPPLSVFGVLALAGALRSRRRRRA